MVSTVANIANGLISSDFSSVFVDSDGLKVVILFVSAKKYSPDSLCFKRV